MIGRFMNIPSADEDEWIVAETEHNGKPSRIRYRPSLKKFLGHEKYPQRLIVIWPYKATEESGLPSKELEEQMEKLEDLLVGALDKDGCGILGYIFTKTGARGWHIYLSDVDEAQQRVNDSLSDQPRFPITLHIEEDPKWETLREVYEFCCEDLD
jgi:hypothetical protein